MHLSLILGSDNIGRFPRVWLVVFAGFASSAFVLIYGGFPFVGLLAAVVGNIVLLITGVVLSRRPLEETDDLERSLQRYAAPDEGTIKKSRSWILVGWIAAAYTASLYIFWTAQTLLNREGWTEYVTGQSGISTIRTNGDISIFGVVLAAMVVGVCVSAFTLFVGYAMRRPETPTQRAHREEMVARLNEAIRRRNLGLPSIPEAMAAGESLPDFRPAVEGDEGGAGGMKLKTRASNKTLLFGLGLIGWAVINVFVSFQLLNMDIGRDVRESPHRSSS